MSYIQDGQASTNAIFGTVGNSAPGLDAVSEIQVLSNSYSAEYGGLAGVVVTTKRGEPVSRHRFYDFNSDALNALTYNQTLVGVSAAIRSADTHEHRWGGSFGGPLVRRASCSSTATTRARTTRPSRRGRANVPDGRPCSTGDFRGTAIHAKIRSPGDPFPNQVIPADRIDPIGD